MRARFRWKWDEELEGEEQDSAADLKKGRRLLWLSILLVAGIIGLFTWQQARRVRLQEEAIEENVRASYRLWRSAVSSGDGELFQFQLSNQDVQWQSGQRELFAQGRLLDRPELGLRHLGLQGEAQIEDVALSPDWQTATLTVDYSYVRDASGQDGPPLRLQQTYFYRRAGERWLLSPGDDAFWGSQQRRVLPGLTVVYPQRDAQLAERLASDLAGDLQKVCQETGDGAGCLETLDLTVRLEPDARLMNSLRDSFTPVFRGGDFVLPAPTLVGKPQDQATYEALYEGYTSRIVNAVRQNLNPPLALPEEALELLCFPAEGRAPRLYRYEPALDEWKAELTDRSFRFLMPGPRGDGVIAQAFTRGPEATRLRLFWWREGQAQLIYDEDMVDQTTRPAGWSDSDQPHLLLQGFSGASTAAQHRWLDLENCDEDGCAVVDLRGYTVWSPDGQNTLVLNEQALWRGDALGEPLLPLGVGLSPFWLDNERYGYVRYDREAGAPSMQIATSDIASDLPSIVMPVGDLARIVDAANPPLLFINYVTPNPADKDLLLIAATTVGAQTAKYNIFSLRLSTGEATLLQQFERLPSGYPSLLTPAGYPPFRLSPDGRWLLVTLLASPSPTTWSFQLYDLQEGETLSLNAYYPAYPSKFAFYDWTPDGRWLVIVEDGYLRLIAPGHGYQKLVSHRLDDCLYVAWVNA